MKVLKGTLKEILYEFPDPEATKLQPQPLRSTKESTFKENDVTYIADDVGLHKVFNPLQDEFAVSLHRKLSALNRKECFFPSFENNLTLRS
jgi:cysteine dioxygenase